MHQRSRMCPTWRTQKSHGHFCHSSASLTDLCVDNLHLTNLSLTVVTKLPGKYTSAMHIAHCWLHEVCHRFVFRDLNMRL